MSLVVNHLSDFEVSLHMRINKNFRVVDLTNLYNVVMYIVISNISKHFIVMKKVIDTT